MNAGTLFERHFRQCPLIGILRGVTPADATAIGGALFDAGIRIIEVPLNSPDPFASIERIAKSLGDDALVGAGTVLDPADVERVKRAGGRLVVSPNMNPNMIAASVQAGLVSCPGIFTPTEAFAALAAGAHALKLFPAEAASPRVVAALRAVLPRDARLIVVGGVTPESITAWTGSGADGFGLGGGLYKYGQSADETLEKARAYVKAVGGR